ncbi:MAG: replication-associated recombination protein A [Ruminococcaceae bacterium]|nr:replication-associated recombination protein A [Oscillospiraceae bacterium]
MISTPLADRLRPVDFDTVCGQSHLFGKNGILKKVLQRGHITNMIFFGPPGTGKTTCANIIAKKSGMTLHKLNATSASLSDIKEVIASADGIMAENGVLLYIDEIQYFNKKQQQSLLEYLENGKITLIASTTENPYIYIYNAIISRSMVFEFKALSADDIVPVLIRGLDILNRDNSSDISCDKDTLKYIAECGAGDVRSSVNLLESAYYISDTVIEKDSVSSLMPKVLGNFDRAGTVHYDMLAGLQKSIRGSDPDATAFYLAKILEGGDMLGAIRRLLVIASEDIGLAYPMAASIVYSCTEAAKQVGMPEARIPLINAALFLATCPKSNSAYSAYANAADVISKGMGQTLPPYMRPVNKYDGYKYPHDYPRHYVKQQYLPDDIKDCKFYEFGDNKTESAAKAYWDLIKGNK